MSSRSADLISRALHNSLPSNCKKPKLSTIDDCIATSARKILSTQIEYVLCPQYSTDEFLKSLKTKYTVLKPKLNKKKKKKKKFNNGENSNSNQLPMKNTELNGQNLSLPAAKYILFAPDDVHLGWKGTIPVGSGFTNLGTTCYVNSTLQALFHVPSFSNWLNNDKKHEVHCEKMNGMLHSECTVCAMRKTLFLTLRANGSTIRPKYIIEKIKTICKHLSPFRQEDAHEFLRYLMEAMEKSYITALGITTKKLDSYSKETTPLNQIFGGYIRTEVTCLECSHVSTTFQHFQDLILDIRQNNTTTLYDGLESYFSKERLDGDEAYHCEHCKKKVSAYKKFSIERTPNVLCIQLKRFNMNSYYGGTKISKAINTPLTIDLSKFKHRKGTSNCKPLKYRLVSMVFHHGPSINSGHYTALGCTSSGSYYYFNDEQVFPVHVGNYTNNPNTYIIFYEREKANLINESKTNLIKSAVNSPAAIPLTNGCASGNVQPPRTNGLFAKRESHFSATATHSKYVAVTKEPVATASKESDTPKPASYRLQSWAPVENKENEPKTPQSQPQPVKSVVTVPAATPVLKVRSTSLVPYMPSSDSDTSDVEPEKSATDSNNNNPTKATSEDQSATLSPLAKKNSTLTSLLTSSPKNENLAYRVAPSSRPLTNGKATKSEEKASTALLQNGNGEIKPSDERTIISFSLFSREKKKMDALSANGTKNSDENGKESGNNGEKAGPSADCQKVNGNRDEVGKTLTSYLQGSRENGLTNGVATKTNGMVNGDDRVKATNGWIVTEMADECNKSEADSSTSNNDWIVTQKENRKLLTKDSNAKQKDNRKCNGNSNGNDNDVEMRDVNYSSPKDAQSTPYHHNLYSSQNGYGGRVHTWNGELSSINRETEQERKEANKRKYSYDEDIDRGKVKKSKYYGRGENCSSSSQPASPRKNLIQQHHNLYNLNNNGKNNANNGNNSNNNGSNHHHHHHHHNHNNRGGRKWQFSQNGFHFNNNNRRPPGQNGHYRHNNNNNYYNHHHHRNGYANSWRR